MSEKSIAAWRDQPTCPGLWIGKNTISGEIMPIVWKEIRNPPLIWRWYGPIPDDTAKVDG